MEEADGILYTETMVMEKRNENVNPGPVLTPKYVRAAHIYNITFSHVRENFAIAGLLPLVKVTC